MFLTILREQNVRVVCLQPEYNDLGVVERLHEADGVQEWRPVMTDARSVPSRTGAESPDLLFHEHPLRRNK